MNVSQAVKTAYHDNSVTKYITLYFPELDRTVTTEQLYQESMRLSESIMRGNSIEFVGCLASKFKINVNSLNEDIKDRKISVKIHTDGTEEDPITLFNGYVDKATQQGDKRIKEIVAYDALYTKGDIDVTDWYNDFLFPSTLKIVRNSLFEFVGIEQEIVDLPNDNMIVDKFQDATDLQAIDVMRAICQINGVFGIINREEKFDYITLQESKKRSGTYPSIHLFPGRHLFPSAGYFTRAAMATGKDPEDFYFYRNIRYEEYTVSPVDKVCIRQTESDEGVTYGSGSNTYIIRGNLFTLGKTEEELQPIAANIYENIHGIYYTPFSANNNGLPFVECGKDAVSYYVLSEDRQTFERKNFYVFSRELSGIQVLKDNYSAKGEKDQQEFVTDLGKQIESVRNQTNNFDSRISSAQLNALSALNLAQQTDSSLAALQRRISELEAALANIEHWESVSALPQNPDSNTWYIIRGEVVVN